MNSSKPRTISVRACLFAALAVAVVLVISWFVPIMTKRTRNPIEMNEIKSLEMAIKGYQTEYSKLPNLGTTDETKYIESTGLLIETLTGRNDRLNPNKIAFYESPSRHSIRSKFGNGAVSTSINEMDVRDPSGNRYRLYFDWNGDKRISSPKEPGADVSAAVLVYSAGRDGDYSTWEDNFTSWEH